MARKRLRPRLLWICSGEASELRRHQNLVQRHFDISDCSRLALAGREIRMLEPAALCFEFEAPTPDDLRILKSTKAAHASLPVLMITEAHSEDLAVWAFRARVWNYLVRPVAAQELEANLRTLASVASAGARRRAMMQPAMASAPRDLPAIEGGADRGRLSSAMQRIQRDYAEPIRATELASLCKLTPFEFSRRFRACYGVNFREYLVRLRIDRARALLDGERRPIVDVAAAVGIPDASHFAALFRRRVGLTPRQYARQRRGAANSLTSPATRGPSQSGHDASRDPLAALMEISS